MTSAWYGHLQYTRFALWKAMLLSWLIAFIEHGFQVPANRLGYQEFNAAQMKTIQEVITLLVFSVFSVLYLREGLRWHHAVGFLFIISAVFFVLKKW